MSNNLDDIIIGISTALSEGAISIIRLSGEGSVDLVNKCFKGKKDIHSLREPMPRRGILIMIKMLLKLAVSLYGKAMLVLLNGLILMKMVNL